MQRFFQEKRTVLSLSILALIALVLLAASLQGIHFRPGELLGGRESIDLTPAVSFGKIMQGAADVPLWKQLLVLGSLFVLVLLVATLLTPEQRKRLIYAFLRLAIFVLVILYIMKKNPEIFAGLLSQLSIPGGISPQQQAANTSAPVFHPPHVSNWLSYVIALTFVSLITWLFWQAYKFWPKLRETASPRRTLEEIAHVARESLHELRSGQNFENAIFECYSRMSHVIAEKKGLHRELAMTPTEFLTRLTQAGLPREPLERLTRLFESTRYGKQAAGPSEIDDAVQSLTSILRYCGEEV